MRLIAKKLRVEIEEMEENKVDERKDDHTIRAFQIPAQEPLPDRYIPLEQKVPKITKTIRIFTLKLSETRTTIIYASI